MRAFARRSLVLLPIGLLAVSSLAFAQDEPSLTAIPNPMGVHTWFIIIAAGALLAWSVSYSLQLQKEALTKKKGRENLRQQKEEWLDKISDLQERRESGKVGERQYKDEIKELKFHLGKVLEKLGSAEAPKVAKKGS